jgi:hypothetical protein
MKVVIPLPKVEVGVELSTCPLCIWFIEVRKMGITKEILTEDKIRKLKPIFERALLRKYGMEFKLLDLSVGHITVNFKSDPKGGKEN